MKIQDYADFFKSLSEPVRLRILYLLMQQRELCVCDLVTALGVSQSVVSRHLAYLRNSGVISARRDGVWMHYRIDTQHEFMLKSLGLFKDFGAKSHEFNSDLAKVPAPVNCC